MDEPRLKTIYREFRDVYRFILSDTFIEETPFDALKALDKANAENNYMRIKLMDEMLKNKSTIATRAIPEEPTGADNLYMMFNSLPERLREDVKFKVETAYKINEKHKRDLNVIYTEG